MSTNQHDSDLTIFGVTGMPLSGKTTVAEMMEERGFSILDMGDVVRKELEKRGLPPGQPAAFVNEQRDKHGQTAIARLSIPYLEELVEETNKIVITGMRSWDEKQHFEQETGKEIDVVAIWAPRTTRRERREERNREEDAEGQAFNERDMRELEQGVGDLIALSDHLIANDGISLEELEESVEHLLKDNLD